MEWLGEVRRRLAALFGRERFDRDLDEEMRLHLEMLTEENREAGLDGEEARYAARRQFGNSTLLKERGRDVWGWSPLESFGRDLRLALRVLAKSPGFTTVAILTLALGIGANSAIFTMVDAFLFRPAPVPGAERLVALATRTPRYSSRPISYPNFLDWKEQNQVFDAMVAHRAYSHILSDDAGAERIPGMDISAGLFDILGVRPALGRDFLPEEHQPGGNAVAILSHELWQRRYGGNPAILGKTVFVNSRPFTVIGIAPPGFRIGPRADVFTSIEQWGREPRASANSLYAVARLKPGVTLEQARGNMDAIAARLEGLYPKANKGQRIEILPFGKFRVREIQTALFMLMAAVGIVLLIACANLSNLLLAKAAGRGREVAIRKALGASRARLVRQLLAESVLLGVIGAGVGLMFGYWGCQGLLVLAGDLDRWPGGEPLGGVHVDTRVLVFTMLLSVLTGVAVGLIPAFQASKGDLTAALKEGGRTGAGGKEGRRLRDLLVTVEVALALVLLIGAGLLIRSLHHLLTVDPGFNPRNVLTLSIAQPTERPSDDLGRRLLEEIQALPGVDSAAAAFPLPFGHGWSGDNFEPEGRPVPEGARFPVARMHYVSPGYLRVLGLRLLAGRWFTASGDDRMAAVINETMARDSWPGEDAVGKRFRLGVPVPNSPWYTVVGVTANTKENGLETRPTPEIYRPVFFSRDILVRTSGDPLAMASAIRARIRSVDRNQAVYDIFPLEQRIDESLWRQRTFAWLLGIFAALALVLAAIGIYGVIAHSVSRRTQEMGIRVALGARPGDVVKLVLEQGMLPVLVGVGLGVAGAYAATRVLRSFLFGVEATDPLTFGSVALLLSAVALLACYFPARRATRIHPVEALRYE